MRVLREAFATWSEVSARRELRRRPWEEEFLHWSCQDGRWVLHGSIPPPRGRRRGVSPGGWCLAQDRTLAGDDGS